MAGGVNRAGVAEVLGEIRQHGFEDSGVHGRRRVVVEINAHDDKLRAFRIAVRAGGVKEQVLAVNFVANIVLKAERPSRRIMRLKG